MTPTGPDTAGDDSDALGWLQRWYAEQCDGEWEQEFGVTVETLDGPGWRVEIDVEGTPVEGRAYEASRQQRSDGDWVSSWLDGETWQATCGPLNLAEALGLFRSWATSA